MNLEKKVDIFPFSGLWSHFFFFFVNIFAEKFLSKCHCCKFYFLIPIRQFARDFRFQFGDTGSCVFYRKKILRR